VYCGSIGYWSVTGDLDTSIAIRTVVARERPRILQCRRWHRGRFRAGAGVPRDTRQGSGHHRCLGFLMVLLIDNYDSFVHNLARYVRELGHDTLVLRK
jgi:hypothetical protein